MKPLLSIVVAHKNDWRELLNTIASIKATAGDAVEVIVVDDYSAATFRIDQPNVRVIENTEWLGVGASRHKGVLAATSDKILLVDSHSRFTPDWLHPTFKSLECSDKLLLCGQCLGLDERNMNLLKPNKVYNGARMIVSDPTAEARYRILNAKWRDDVRGRDGYPLSAVMGASYAFHKQFFLDIGGLEILRGWGKDEEFLSLKWLLSGGEIRMCKSLRVGHVFRDSAERIPYRVDKYWYFYNVLATAMICCPTDVADELMGLLSDSKGAQAAMGMVGELQNRAMINSARDVLQSRQKLSWKAYLNRIAAIDAPC